MSTAWGWDSMCSLEDCVYSLRGSDDSDDSQEAMVSIDVLGVKAYGPQCNP